MSSDASNSAPAVKAAPAPPAVEKKDDSKIVPIVAPASADVKEAAAAETKAATKPGSAPDAAPAPEASSSEVPVEVSAANKASEKPQEKSDVDMTDAGAAPAESEPTTKPDEAAEKAEPEQAAETATAGDAAEDAAASANKAKNAKRKSISAPESSKGKKLNKKASKARITHINAEPGEHYFVKLKGFPQWPVIICDEEMLPESLIKSRPVTARRQDGTYREDYADDDSKKAADRTFPVMYLHTNEFGWVPNTDLIDLDPTNVLPEKMDKMRKDLAAAYVLASENHPLEFYKEVLQQFQEDLLEKEKAKAAKAATPKTKKKSSAPPEDEDVDMEDAGAGSETPAKDKKAKKRKAEEATETPARTDSVKKPKIKLTSSATPKTTNGATATPKSTKGSTAEKATKAKSKKGDEKKAASEKETATPKEPELTPAEKHDRKEREVLFLRHKLQKGLLTRDQEPKEDEMHLMSEYIKKLEALPDLEVSIIRLTKINKVLKAILKLDKIPKEEEFHFKDRSQALLDTWNKLLASEGSATAPEGANGVNGTKEAKEAKEAKTNGLKESSKSAEPAKAKEESSAEDKSKETPKEKSEEVSAEPVEATEKAEKTDKTDKTEKTEKPEKTEETKTEAAATTA